MALPGVPRSKRVIFVEELIGLLLEEGLDEITKSEYDRLYKMIMETMDSITPVPEKIEEIDTEKKPGGC